MPNPNRALAQGDPIYTSWIDIFCDDVSGNRSKSWNKHWNMYISHRNLPRKFLQQEFHTHFVSTSPNATISEQFHGLKRVLECVCIDIISPHQLLNLTVSRSTHKEPLKVRHGSTGQQTRLRIYANCGPGDNPAQSDISCHIGANGNFPCRKCMMGGPQALKETDAGFHSLFEVMCEQSSLIHCVDGNHQPGDPRSVEGILSEVKYQIKLSCLGVAQNVQNRQTETGTKDSHAQYWINCLMMSARTLHKEKPQLSATYIQEELLKWVEQNKKDIYNPFLTLEGEYATCAKFKSMYVLPISPFRQDSTLPLTHLWRSSTRSYWVS